VDFLLFLAAVSIVAVIAVLLVRTLHKKNRQLRRDNAGLAGLTVPAPYKSAEEQQSQHLDRQLEAVIREHVTFSKRTVMGRGEFEVFRAALGVTRQPMPTGSYPFYVFPQVSLGQIIRTEAAEGWHADQAHRAINSKRCDVLIADRHGNPVAVLEYQGSGHSIGGTAGKRDTIKRIALERAGVRFIEIKDGTTQAEIERTIRNLLIPAA
jgi:hypothetical protein